MKCLMLGSSALAESQSLLPRNTHGTISYTRQDIAKAGAIISDVVNTQAMVNGIMRGQEGVGGQDRLVSTLALPPRLNKH